MPLQKHQKKRKKWKEEALHEDDSEDGVTSRKTNYQRLLAKEFFRNPKTQKGYTVSHRHQHQPLVLTSRPHLVFSPSVV